MQVQDETPPMPLARARVAGVAILLSTITSCVAMAAIVPVLPAMQAHFADQPGAGFLVRFLLSLMGPVMIIGAPLGAFLGERFGARRFVLFSMVVFGITGSIGYFVDNLYVIVFSRIIMGLMLAAGGTILTTMMATYFIGNDRNKWLGYMATAGMMFGLMVFPISGWLSTFGWPAVFLFHAIAFPIALILAFGLPKDEPRRAAPAAEAGPVPAGETFRFPWLLATTAVACGMAANSATLYVPYHVSDIGEKDPAMISMVLLAPLITSALTAFGFGYVRSRISTSAIFSLALLAIGIGYVGVSTTTTVTGVMIWLGIAGLGKGITVPALFSHAATMGSGVHRGRLIGIAKAGIYAGPLVTHILLSPVLAYGKSAGAMLALGIFATLVGLLYVGVTRSTSGWRAQPA